MSIVTQKIGTLAAFNHLKILKLGFRISKVNWNKTIENSLEAIVNFLWWRESQEALVNVSNYTWYFLERCCCLADLSVIHPCSWDLMNERSIFTASTKFKLQRQSNDSNWGVMSSPSCTATCISIGTKTCDLLPAVLKPAREPPRGSGFALTSRRSRALTGCSWLVWCLGFLCGDLASWCIWTESDHWLSLLRKYTNNRKPWTYLKLPGRFLSDTNVFSLLLTQTIEHNGWTVNF